MTEPLYPAPPDLDPAWTADTVAVRAGRPARIAGAPMNPPISPSATYVHDASLGYGRDGNQTWGALEAALGVLDGGRPSRSRPARRPRLRSPAWCRPVVSSCCRR